VAATRQHVGKTSVSLALMSGLQKRFDKVGFIKPVGQQSVEKTVVDCESGDTTPKTTKVIKVDKDAALVKDHFRLDHISYKDSSPVLIPPGYTRDYLDGTKHDTVSRDSQMQQLRTSFDRINAASDICLCEGTGHVAVGSIVDLNNAECAKLLDDAHMILVANGGLGHCFDELELNRTLCAKLNVHIAGIVLNKVLPEKYAQTKHYFTKALEQKWDDIPLLGCIPDRPFLGSPALADLERLVKAEFISGGIHRLRHFRANDCRLVATSLEVFLQMVQQLENQTDGKKSTERKLFVCHASRNDIVLGYIMMMETMARQAKVKDDQDNSGSSSSDSDDDDDNDHDNVPIFRSAMLITGACNDKAPKGLSSESFPLRLTNRSFLLPLSFVIVYCYQSKNQ
jgi:BioD-like phosphotransacetylase family protein